MIRKILVILLVIVLVVSLTGCKNNSTFSKTDDSYNNCNEKDTNNDTNNNSSKVVYKTYYCSQVYDDDEEYYLYYENDKLVKITGASIYADNDDYKEAQEEIKGINGLSVTRKNNKLYLDYDMKYVDSFADKQSYFDFSNTSYESMNSQLKNKGFNCTLNE